MTTLNIGEGAVGDTKAKWRRSGEGGKIQYPPIALNLILAIAIEYDYPCSPLRKFETVFLFYTLHLYRWI